MGSLRSAIRLLPPLVRPGGTIAVTDWIEGAAGLSDDEAERYLRFMKFPSVLDLSGYAEFFEANGCEVVHAEDTGRFGPCAELYVRMLKTQLTYDALKIVGFDLDLFQGLGGELEFVRDLACGGKIAQGLFVARKRR